MYSYTWDKKTRGYKLTTQTGKFVASEIRPVYAEELLLLHADEKFEFDHNETAPLMWAKQNSYFYNGEECGKVVVGDNQQLLFSTLPDFERKKLQPTDIDAMIDKNQKIMSSLVADTLKRIKEMYDEYQSQCDIAYIGFSGGKDSMVLLDLCHKVLPMTVPVVFSDTDMELPDTYKTWELVEKRYAGRPFIKVQADKRAAENWKLFGPPSQNLRWCCAVHKSTPAILCLRELAKNPAAKTLAFVGVRADESLRRSAYEDIGDGLKNQNQVNAMPILAWGTHELFLYTFKHNLIVNQAYRKGLPRVGCLLCPMSSDRQAQLIKNLYPDAVNPFIAIIKESIARDFSSESDFDKFIIEGGWHARQSGVSLREVIPAPTEKKEKGMLFYSFQPIPQNNLLEWLKTIGYRVQNVQANELILGTNQETFPIRISGEPNGITQLECVVTNHKNAKNIAKHLKNSLHKAIACVACGACGSECPTGALSFTPEVHVDLEKCIHCLKCHVMQDGCMRFYSRRYAGGQTMNISGINKYMTFGLKREWVEVLSDEAENFRATSALGNRMIPSAVTWFREAKLITDSSTVQPTRLLQVGQTLGFESPLFWSLIWIALANSSPLIKWFICHAPLNELISVETLNDILSTQVSSESVRKGAMQSLCGTIKNSPVGLADTPIVQFEQKGVRVTGFKRMAQSVEPLVVLYSLYLIANVANRTSFTLSEMMTADFDSPFISPLVAFGMSVEELKGQCMGIASIYPNFLSCSFTLGLDEVKVFPQEKKLDDVIGLILGE